MTYFEINIDGVIGRQSDEDKPTNETFYSFEDMKRDLEPLKAFPYELLFVNIRSTGGNCAHALLMYEYLKELGIPVITRCYGYCASGGTIIAQAASKGGRQMSENGLYLIHNARGEDRLGGTSSSHEMTVNELKKTDGVIANIYASNSKKSSRFYLTQMGLHDGEGEWLNFTEAKEMGLVDGKNGDDVCLM